jgi:hypothetical protein
MSFVVTTDAHLLSERGRCRLCDVQQIIKSNAKADSGSKDDGKNKLCQAFYVVA